MIRFFPYYRMKLETELPLQEVRTRFEQSTGEDTYWLWPWAPFPDEAFVGNVTNKGFVLRNSAREGGPFSPKAYGRFIEGSKHTSVDVRIMIRRDTLASMILMLLVMLSCLTAVLLGVNLVSIYQTIVLIASISFVLSYLFSIMAFNAEIGNTAELIHQIVSQRGLDAEYRESIVRKAIRYGRISTTVAAILIFLYGVLAIYEFAVR